MARTLMRLRNNARLSQRDLVEVSGVSLATIRDIETGKQPRPKPDTLRLIADGLATPVGGSPAKEEALEAFSALMVGAGYVDRVEPGPFYEERVNREVSRMLASLSKGGSSAGLRDIEQLMTRLQFTLTTLPPRQHFALKGILLFLVEMFTPSDLGDDEELNDVELPKLDVLVSRLLILADEAKPGTSDPEN